MFPPREDLYRLLPELVACVFGTLVMLAEPWVARQNKRGLVWLALVGAGLSLAAVPLAAAHPGAAVFGLMQIDDFSVFLHILVFGIGVLAVLASCDYLEREGLQQGEYYALVLFATAGMGVMAGAGELMTAFVGLEISSMASYVLAGYRRDAMKSNEAALKYFLLGSFATAFFLYGVAMVYGATGTTRLAALATRLARFGLARFGLASQESMAPLLTLGLGMMFVGLGFKVATAPFQLWTPDVYEGAPTPVTALFASAPKAAAMALMLRIFFTGFGTVSGSWFWAIWASAALTMFVGNVAALVQTNVKRTLAYSSIAHAGYMMVAFAAAGAGRSDVGIAAMLFYLVAYALMKLGAFTTVAHLGGAGEQRVYLDDYAGLGWRQPVTAACLSLYLLSLLGLPATAGFLGKLYVFNAALGSKLVWLAVLLAVNSVIAAYYYLRIIVAMYMREPIKDWTPAPVPLGVGAVLLVTAAGTVYFGLFPGAVMSLATQGAQALR